MPLKGNYDETKYKLYFFDTGIFVAMLDEEAQEDLRANKNLGVYKGALYENIVGEALIKCGYGLYYYKKDDSYLEEDFFVRTKDYLLPVEVKATNGTAKLLRRLRATVIQTLSMVLNLRQEILDIVTIFIHFHISVLFC